MNTQIIKPNQTKLEMLFPNSNLDKVTKTCDVTLSEFEKLWLATGGFKHVGNQYSNMNEYNYLFAASQDNEPGYADVELSSTITDYKESNWVNYYARAGKKIAHTKTADKLHPDFTVVYRKRFKYGDDESGLKVIARRSKCGEYVTVFRTKP